MITIITHPATAHRDDFLACCVLLGHLTEPCMIVRREPTEEELNDPDIWVLDIGGRHEPELHNFDHHQLPRDHDPECALSLLCRFLGLHEAFGNIYAWYAPTAIADSKGPIALARALTMTNMDQVWAAQSPVEGHVLRMFAEHKGNIHNFSPIGNLMQYIGDGLLTYVSRYVERLVLLTQECKTYVFEGCTVVQHQIKEDSALALTEWCQTRDYPVSATITPDDRSDGWCIFRMDDKALDLSKIEGKPGVIFAHKNGFIAKVEKTADLPSLIQLAILES